MFKRSEHEKVEELLSIYIDGQLSPGEATLVERHLRDCSACTRDLESLRQTVNLVRQLPVVSPPRSFTISHLVVAERPWAWGYVYLKGATALAALLLIVLLAGDLGFQYLWAPRMAAPLPAPMALEATIEAPKAEIEVPGETPVAREALDLMEAQKAEETPSPLAEATLPAEGLAALPPSPEPTSTPEMVAAAEPTLPAAIPEATAYSVEREERVSAFLPTLRLLEGALFGLFLILGGTTALLAWRRR